MTRERSFGTRLADAAYRALLRVLPRALRRDFGDDMTQLFRDRRRAAGRSPWRLGWLWLSAVADVARTAAGARRRSRDGRAPAERPRRPWLSSIAQDVRFAFRLGRRERGFTLAVVAVLGLGVGVASAAFMCVNTLLLKPLPGRPAGIVAGIYSRDRTPPGQYRAFSYDDVRLLAARTDVFTHVAAHDLALAGLADGDRTRQVLVELITANYFDAFGARPILGRGFTEAEARPGSGAGVALLSYAEWQHRGGSADILGQSIRLNGRLLTIVGVTGPGFAGSLVLIAPPVWVPVSAYDWIASSLTREGSATSLEDPATRQLVVVAQLRPGLTLDRVAPALQTISAARALAAPALAHESLEMAPLARLSISTKPETNAPLESIAAALLVLGLIVLLIASLNVANMLLARAAGRRREFAIRRAIGGGRARLVRQWMIEGLVLAFAGGAVGVLLACWAMSLITAGLGAIAPVVIDFDPVPDARVLAATCGFVVFAAIVFSVGPAWAAARQDPAPDLRASGAEASGRARMRGRHLLVTAQLALSVVMLVATAMFVRSAREAANADPGFPVDRGLVLHLDAGLGGRTPVEAAATYERVLDRLRAEPDVAAASLSTRMPFDGFSTAHPLQRAGAPLPADDPALVSAETVYVGADYFKTMTLPVRRGREFTVGEEAGTSGASLAVIDEPLAIKLFGSDDPVGRILQDNGVIQGAPPTTLQVIGVVPGVRVELFDPAPTPHVYLAYRPQAGTEVYLQVRTTAATGADEVKRLPDLARLVQTVDPASTVLSAETRAAVRDRSPLLGIVRTGARVFTAFGLCALVLAAAGVYAVKAYIVARRTREIGIRVALGASRASVLGSIAGEGLLIGAGGLVVGAALAVVVGRGLRSMTYAARGADAGTMTAAMVVLLLATMLASVVPARRAARIDPARALRE